MDLWIHSRQRPARWTWQRLGNEGFKLAMKDGMDFGRRRWGISQAGKMKGKTSRHYGKARVARDRTVTCDKHRKSAAVDSEQPNPSEVRHALARQPLRTKCTCVFWVRLQAIVKLLDADHSYPEQTQAITGFTPSIPPRIIHGRGYFLVTPLKIFLYTYAH